MPGGYVGVDVFFVISGYLITRIILFDVDSGSFSLLEFYERRVRRILPALIFVVLCSWPAAWFLMWASQLESFAESVMAVGTFTANFYFQGEEGYFQPASELQPLLHTWSLAVEEQFYIVFPLVIILCRPLPRQVLVIAFAAVMLISLLLAQWGGNLRFAWPPLEQDLFWFNQPTWASFYHPVGRAWELLAGCLTAYALQRQTPLQNIPKWHGPAAFGGLLLIMAAVSTFDQDTPAPGFATVVPVAGTVLVICFAGTRTIVGRLLSARGLVFVGLASYSIYLWHFPFFAFARLHDPSAGENHVLMTCLGIASVLAGFITWRFIERPFRDRRNISRRAVFRAAGLFMTLFVAAGYLADKLNIAQTRYAPQLAVTPEQHGAYVEKRSRELNDARPSDAGGRRIVVIGDSFAQDLINMGYENGYFADSIVHIVYVSSDCQVYLGDEGVSDLIKLADQAFCAKEYKRLVAAKRLIGQANVVIVSARWREWAVDRLPETLRRLRRNASQKFLVVGSKYFGPVRLRDFADADIPFRAGYRNSVPALPINARLRDKVRSEDFINVQELACGRDRRCPVFTPEGELISHDGLHLTKNGAAYIGDRVFRDPRLSGLRLLGQ